MRKVKSGSGSTVTEDLVRIPSGALPVPGSTERRYYIINKIPAGYAWAEQQEVPEEEATLVASTTQRNTHAPAIDLDVPAFLVPSSTPGHSHLYIDVEMSWWKYRVLLWVLKFTGIIEPGYYRASIHRKASFLRRPGVMKEAS